MRLLLIYLNLGSEYNSLGDYQRAVEYHERALRLNQETGNKQGEASAYKRLGITYHSLRDYRRAEEYHERALRLNQETGNKQEEASACKRLGITYHSLGDYQRAVDYHERELKLNRETRLVSIFINRKYVSFLYIKRYHMLNLLSCLDFVFVFCVFNFAVSCPSRHMRWKLFPDMSKDYS